MVRNLFLLALLACCWTRLSALTAPEEIACLEAIFQSTNGDGWSYNGTLWYFGGNCSSLYDASCDPCDGGWQGVECVYEPPLGPAPDCGGGSSVEFSDGNGGTVVLCVDSSVVGLDMQYFGMNGTLPDCFGQLPTIEAFAAPNNYIRGQLPPSLFASSIMEFIQINNNTITGPLPNFAYASGIKAIRLNSNQITGPIPPTTSAMTNLTFFDLSDNKINGTLPFELLNRSSLLALTLAGNDLTGSIRSSIALLSRISLLALEKNCFAGTIPPEIGSLQRLKLLTLRENSFTGPIPNAVGSLNNLIVLNLGRNSFSGTIPSSYYKLTSLSVVLMDYLKINTTIPSEIGNLSNLLELNLEGCGIFGSLPTSMSSMRKIRILQVDDNSLSGALPSFLGLWTSVELIDFDSNKFSGTIPTVWASMKNIVSLDVSSNFKIDGPFPAFVSGFSRLKYLELDSNKLTGSLPSGLSVGCPSLEYFDIGFNSISGTLPSDIWNFSRLEIIYMFKNKLSGAIPSDFSNAARLQYLRLERNDLSGTIPSTIGCLTMLNDLLLNENKLTGKIPESIGSIKSLKTFTAALNSLTGPLPASISKLEFLADFIVQQNALSGSLDNVFSETQNNLVTIDISDNIFSGTIASSLYNHTSLKVLSTSLNCFEGEIPSDICKYAPFLNELILDGLTSGRDCSNEKSFFGFKFLSSRVYGTLPECFFQMKNLSKLHASGNGIRGNLGEISPDSPLRNIELAWNNIDGTIPVGYGSLRFDSFDISVNRITGQAVPIGINDENEDALIKMNGNRLSGDIPVEYREMLNINMLDGNMFQCSGNREELPSNDPQRVQYSCGSQFVNATLILWGLASLIAILLALYHMIIYYEVPLSSWVGVLASLQFLPEKLKSHLSLYFGFSKHPIFMSFNLPALFPRVAYYHRMYSHLRTLVLIVTAIIVCIFLPLYSIIFAKFASQNNSSMSLIYEKQYTWSVSSLWGSGVVYASILMVLWFLVIVVVTKLMYKEVRLQLKSRFIALAEKYFESSAKAESSGHGSFGTNKDRSASVDDEEPIRTTASRLTGQSSRFTLRDRDSDTEEVLPAQVYDRHISKSEIKKNPLMMPVTSDHSWSLTFKEIVLILVNILVVLCSYTGFIVGLQSDASFLVKILIQLSLSSFTIFWGRVMDIWILHVFSGYEHSPYRLYFGVLTFNIILAPFIVGAAIDSNCFFYLTNEPDALETETTTNICIDWTLVDFKPFCKAFGPLSFTNSFVPSYTYHCSCSHSIITRYIPSLVLFYFMNCFLVSLLKYKMFFRTSENFMDRFYKALPEWWRHIIPTYLLSPEVNEQSYNKFPSARMLATSHVNLTVLLTFGLVFPPLAVIIALLVLVQSWLHLEMIAASLHAWFRQNGDSLAPGYKKNGGMESCPSQQEAVTNPVVIQTPLLRNEANSSKGPLKEAHIRSSFSEQFAVDPKILDIYLSADCIGFIPCGAWMCIISAAFHCVLYSDMVSDDIGFKYIYAFWAAAFASLLMIFVTYAYFVRIYIPKPRFQDSFNTSLSLCSTVSETMHALWNLCFGDSEDDVPTTVSGTTLTRPSTGVEFASRHEEDAEKTSIGSESGSGISEKSKPKLAEFKPHEDF